MVIGCSLSAVSLAKTAILVFKSCLLFIPKRSGWLRCRLTLSGLDLVSWACCIVALYCKFVQSFTCVAIMQLGLLLSGSNTCALIMWHAPDMLRNFCVVSCVPVSAEQER